MERHSKGEFHVFVKKLKLFDHEFLILAANERACYYHYCYYYYQFDFVPYLPVLESIFDR